MKKSERDDVEQARGAERAARRQSMAFRRAHAAMAALSMRWRSARASGKRQSARNASKRRIRRSCARQKEQRNYMMNFMAMEDGNEA